MLFRSLVIADIDADVGNARVVRREEDQVARLQVPCLAQVLDGFCDVPDELTDMALLPI